MRRKDRSGLIPMGSALLGGFAVLAHTAALHGLRNPSEHDLFTPDVNVALALLMLVLAVGLFTFGAVSGARRGDRRPLVVAGLGGLLALPLTALALRDSDGYLAVLAGIFASLIIAAAAMRPEVMGEGARTPRDALRGRLRWRVARIGPARAGAWRRECRRSGLQARRRNQRIVGRESIR